MTISSRNMDKAADAFIAASMQGLPKLKGSEKQMVWALNIRNEKLREAFEFRKSSPNEYQLLRLQDSAKWWIDHREDSPTQLLSSISRLHSAAAAL